MVEAIRDPDRFFACSEVGIKERAGFAQKIITANGEIYPENAYEDELRVEVVYRKLVNGPGTGRERAMSLRMHPFEMESHMRNKVEGFRAQWDMPEAAVLGPWLLLGGSRGLSYDSLFAAVGISIVGHGGCSTWT